MLAQEGGGAEGCGDGSGDGSGDGQARPQVIGAGGGIGLLGRFLLFGGADDDDGAGVIGGGRDDFAATRIGRNNYCRNSACGLISSPLIAHIVGASRKTCNLISTALNQLEPLGSVAYSIAAVVPVILPSLLFAEVGATPAKPVGAAGTSGVGLPPDWVAPQAQAPVAGSNSWFA